MSENRRGWARIRREGQVAEQKVTLRSGAKQTSVEISTPCCGVTYRVDLGDVEWQRKRPGRSQIISCGKRRHGRGNTPGQTGCRAWYHVTFEGDPPEVARWTWTGH